MTAQPATIEAIRITHVFTLKEMIDWQKETGKELELLIDLKESEQVAENIIRMNERIIELTNTLSNINLYLEAYR